MYKALAMISDTGWNVIGAVLLALINVIGVIMMSRQKTHNQQQELRDRAHGEALDEVRLHTNSMMEQLVEFTREKAAREGRETGRLEEIERMEQQKRESGS